MKNFIDRNRKGLAALIVAAGVAFTPVPSVIWSIVAPMAVDAAAEAVE